MTRAAEMDASGKQAVKNALSKDAKERLTETGWLLKLANAVRSIDQRTETEVWEIGAEAGVEYLKKLGLDMAEGVAKDMEDIAATTACLFFGFLDGATNISETCDGGGGNNELPRKKEDEDELAFAKRCHQVAKAMHAPKVRLKR